MHMYTTLQKKVAKSHVSYVQSYLQYNYFLFYTIQIDIQILSPEFSNTSLKNELQLTNTLIYTCIHTLKETDPRPRWFPSVLSCLHCTEIKRQKRLPGCDTAGFTPPIKFTAGIVKPQFGM